MEKYRLVVMTYKRKKFKALHLLEQDPNIQLYLAVRKEEYEAGYYKHLAKIPRLHFLLLENVTDAGDTRQRIIDMCYADNVEYCIELDDAVSKLYNPFDETMSIHDCIMKTIEQMETDEHADKIVSSQFLLYDKQDYGRVKFHYHTSNMQAFIVNVKKLIEETSVRFRTIAECGFDDACFSYELHINGWASVKSHYCFRRVRTWAPYVAKKGGTHADKKGTIAAQCERNNERHLMLINFLHKTYHQDNIILKSLYRTIKDVRYDFYSVHYKWNDEVLLNAKEGDWKNYEQSV